MRVTITLALAGLMFAGCGRQKWEFEASQCTEQQISEWDHVNRVKLSDYDEALFRVTCVGDKWKRR